LCRLLGRLKVGVVRASLHVVDLLTIQLERDPQLDQCFDLALPRQDTLFGGRDRLEMAGADGGKADTSEIGARSR
jgi:hypothetical protein